MPLCLFFTPSARSILRSSNRPSASVRPSVRGFRPSPSTLTDVTLTIFSFLLLYTNFFFNEPKSRTGLFTHTLIIVRIATKKKKHNCLSRKKNNQQLSSAKDSSPGWFFAKFHHQRPTNDRKKYFHWKIFFSQLNTVHSHSDGLVSEDLIFFSFFESDIFPFKF